MSARSRRQTRSRRFNLPPERWPLNHNAAVHARKHPRKGPTLGTIAAALITFGQVGLTADLAAKRITEATTSLDETITRWQTEMRRTRRRADIRRRFNTLTRLAANGYDVRDEMDALAAEEAELAGIPVALDERVPEDLIIINTTPKETR